MGRSPLIVRNVVNHGLAIGEPIGHDVQKAPNGRSQAEDEEGVHLGDHYAALPTPGIGAAIRGAGSLNGLIDFTTRLRRDMIRN